MVSLIRQRRNAPTPSVLDWFDGGELDRWFARAVGAPSLSGWSPAVDVEENENAFVVTAELAGLSEDDVELSLENGVLSISGEKREEREEGNKEAGRHIYERRYGRFERNFSLPRTVDADKVDATFKNGVLTVTLPKTAAAKPRRIAIGK